MDSLLDFRYNLSITDMTIIITARDLKLAFKTAMRKRMPDISDEEVQERWRIFWSEAAPHATVKTLLPGTSWSGDQT